MSSETEIIPARNRRRFVSDVPPNLLKDKPEDVAWMYHQQSIQRQQNEAIMDRLDEGELRFIRLEKARKAHELDLVEKIKEVRDETQTTAQALKIDTAAIAEKLRLEVAQVASKVVIIDKFKERLTAKWTVVAFIVCAIIGPIGLALIAAAFTRFAEKIWK